MGLLRPLTIVLVLCLGFLVTAPSAGADAIDDYITAEMQRRQIPGPALAVVKGGRLVKLQGYGFANLEHDVRVTPDTVFELASVTKQFTATAIMVLVGDGSVRGASTRGGLTYGVPGRYVSGLLVGPVTPAPDPEPARSAALRAVLEALDRGEDPPAVLPKFHIYVSREAARCSGSGSRRCAASRS